MIKVLVVEDAPVVRALLLHILRGDPDIQVLATANDGAEALAALARLTPDVITMDIHMPGMDGLEATRRIMETRPIPIVIVSGSWNADEVVTTFRALEAGAVALVEKPRGLNHAEYPVQAAKLLQTIKAMAQVQVVQRLARPGLGQSISTVSPASEVRSDSEPIRLVAIGASTGGPPVLHTILAGLPKNYPVPVLIVQHIAAGFVDGLAAWLHQVTGLPLHVAMHGERPLPGHVYLAPDSAHLEIDWAGRISLSQTAPENGLRPAVSPLFRSVSKHFGANAVGVLLTGMGKDGAEELKQMRDTGAVTIAQDQASSVVFGMPGEAIKLDAATHVLAPDKIAALLMHLAGRG